MLPHALTNFEIQKYCKNEPKFNSGYSRNNLPKIKDGTYIINFREFKSIGTHWITLYVKNENARYFDSFGVENIPKEIRKSIINENIVRNSYRIQAYDSIIGRYFCIGFIDCMLTSKSLLEYTNLLSPNDYEKNDKIILK